MTITDHSLNILDENNFKLNAQITVRDFVCRIVLYLCLIRLFYCGYPSTPDLRLIRLTMQRTVQMKSSSTLRRSGTCGATVLRLVRMKTFFRVMRP